MAWQFNSEKTQKGVAESVIEQWMSFQVWINFRKQGMLTICQVKVAHVLQQNQYPVLMLTVRQNRTLNATPA